MDSSNPQFIESLFADVSYERNGRAIEVKSRYDLMSKADLYALHKQVGME